MIGVFLFNSIIFLFSVHLLVEVEAISSGTLSNNYKGRLGAVLVDSRKVDGEFIQCSGALISKKHVLTSRLCCFKSAPRFANPTVILGSTVAYDETGERFRTIKSCWIGPAPVLTYLQTCLLTLSRPVIFGATVQPFLLPVTKNEEDYFAAGTMLVAFGFGSTTSRQHGLSRQLQALKMAKVANKDECKIGGENHECAQSLDSVAGALNYNDIGGPVTTGIHMELYGIAGSWHIPDASPARSIIIPIAPIKDFILDEMANKDNKCLT